MNVSSVLIVLGRPWTNKLDNNNNIFNKFTVTVTPLNCLVVFWFTNNSDKIICRSYDVMAKFGNKFMIQSNCEMLVNFKISF